MTLNRDAKLFVGFRLEGKLRESFDAKERSTYVGEDGHGAFLTTLSVDGARYLGKIVDGGFSTDRLDDVTRNVLSILARFNLGQKLPAALSIFAVNL